MLPNKKNAYNFNYYRQNFGDAIFSHSTGNSSSWSIACVIYWTSQVFHGVLSEFFDTEHSVDLQVCREFLPSNGSRISWSEHSFWHDKYCHNHNSDGTPRCTGCERLKPRGEAPEIRENKTALTNQTNYVIAHGRQSRVSWALCSCKSLCHNRKVFSGSPVCQTYLTYALMYFTILF